MSSLPGRHGARRRLSRLGARPATVATADRPTDGPVTRPTSGRVTPPLCWRSSRPPRSLRPQTRLRLGFPRPRLPRRGRLPGLGSPEAFPPAGRPGRATPRSNLPGGGRGRPRRSSGRRPTAPARPDGPGVPLGCEHASGPELAVEAAHLSARVGRARLGKSDSALSGVRGVRRGSVASRAVKYIWSRVRAGGDHARKQPGASDRAPHPAPRPGDEWVTEARQRAAGLRAPLRRGPGRRPAGSRF